MALNSVPCYSGRKLYAGVPLFEKIFSDRIACRVLVFLTKEKTIHKWNFIKFEFTMERGI
jgi:hypothetical protein